jgi:hypothetical protein
LKGPDHLLVWLPDHCAQGTLEELRLRVGSPGLGNGAVAAAHRGLELLVFNLSGQVRGKVSLHRFIYERNDAETELERDVVVKLEHIFDGQEDSPEGIFNDVFTHLAGGRNGH